MSLITMFTLLDSYVLVQAHLVQQLASNSLCWPGDLSVEHITRLGASNRADTVESEETFRQWPCSSLMKLLNESHM